MSIATGLRVKAYLGMNWTASDAKKRIHGIPAAVQLEWNHIVERNTIRMWQLAKAMAPVQKGVQPSATLKNAIRYIFFDNPLGKVGSVYVGRMTEPRKITHMDIKTRKAYGKARARKVPIYVEFGTVQSGSREFLLPALRKFYPRFEHECLEAAKRFGGD